MNFPKPNRKQTIKHEVGAMSPSDALVESMEWLEIIRSAPPPGWTQAIIDDQTASLEELKEKVRGLKGKKDPDYYRVKERLAGYVERMRGRNDGKTPAEVRGRVV